MTRNFQKLNNIVDLMPSNNVLCVGDMMIDEYISGSADRLSPEAPVPVIHQKSVRQVLGGVGNVAANLKALGCETAVFYAVGPDQGAQQVRDMLDTLGIKAYPHEIGVITTKKQRIMAQKQQICRIDTEEPLALTKQQEDRIIHQVSSLLPHYNVVILSDYNKGLISRRVAQGIIQEAAKQKKYILVDPKGTDYTKYAGASLIKPNLNELKTAVGTMMPEVGSAKDLDPRNPEDLETIKQLADVLRKRLNINDIIVTLGENGMMGVNNSGAVYQPTQVKSVSDVSGAGDTSLAILSTVMPFDVSMENAIDLANIGAGIVVSKEGTATLSMKELRGTIKNLFHIQSWEPSFPVSQQQDR